MYYLPPKGIQAELRQRSESWVVLDFVRIQHDSFFDEAFPYESLTVCIRVDPRWVSTGLDLEFEEAVYVPREQSRRLVLSIVLARVLVMPDDMGFQNLK